jgi:ASC-1-like (ASCH) protein
MKKEYSYYHILPEDMRYFFIPTFNYREVEGMAQYSVERLSVPDLAVQWIHFSISDSQFEKLMDRLFRFIDARQRRELPKVELLKHADSLYLGKVKSRLDQLKRLEAFKEIESIFSSVTPYESVDSLFEKYYLLYAKWRDHKNFATAQVIGHGDFCFSNILYDKRIDLLKLIDPKGSTTLEGAYLDSYYDVAKLSHSVLGNYDFINNGLYEFIFNESLQASIVIKSTDTLSKKKELFKHYLTKSGFDFGIVRLCELSLFLSMTPLHIDNKKNVLAFLLNASAIIDDLDK